MVSVFLIALPPNQHLNVDGTSTGRFSDVSARESCPVCPHAGASGLLSYPLHGSEALYVGYSRDAWNGTLWLGRYDNKVSPRDKVLPMELAKFMRCLFILR